MFDSSIAVSDDRKFVLFSCRFVADVRRAVVRANDKRQVYIITVLFTTSILRLFSRNCGSMVKTFEDPDTFAVTVLHLQKAADVVVL